MVSELQFTHEINEPFVPVKFPGHFSVGDQEAHKIIVNITKDGQAQTLTGYTVTGYVVRADNSSVVVTGVVDGSSVYIVLPQAAYAVAGGIGICIRIVNGTEKHTVLWLTGDVIITNTGTIIDPGTVVPSLEELLAQISACQTATTAANNAASSASTAASSATNAASSATTAASSASSAATAANTAATAAGNVNATVSKSGHTATLTVTNNQGTAQTVQIYDGDGAPSVTSVNGETGDVVVDSVSTATTASKLGTDAGSSTQPVYFSSGVPVACDSTFRSCKVVAKSLTVSSSSTTIDLSTSVTESGYTPLGIVGINIGSLQAYILSHYVSGSMAYLTLQNPLSSALSGTATLYILYQKA